MRFTRHALGLLILALVLQSCSTLKSWFTPQGQKLSQARELADHGHPLGASALALEALVIEPDYKEARQLLAENFGAGQKEFAASEKSWTASEAKDRFDRLYELYGWQQTLARDGGAVDASYRVESVDDKLHAAARGASEYHWQKGRDLLEAAPGPRQARKALSEGRTAARFDKETPGLPDWLEQTTDAATQKLLIVPFFSEVGRGSPVSGPLASRVSEKLIGGALPELTTVFPSDRLVTLPGGGLARLGLISQPDALKLAADAGQNLVLMGQMTRVSVQEPLSKAQTSNREKKVLFIDPEHPKGVEKVYKAVVTTTVWTSSVSLAASFNVVEVATTQDLVTAVRSVQTSDETTLTSFTGDQEALTADDLIAVATKQPLTDTDTLWNKALDQLAAEVAQAVRSGLR